MITANDAYLAAGFLLGEGSFTDRASNPRISAPQVEKAPLAWLKKTFGGNLYRKHSDPSKLVKTPCDLWIWHLSGVKAIGLMMSLFPVMRKLSPKRCREIRSCLKSWRKRGPTRANQTKCIRGHEFYQNKRQRRCKQCIKIWNAQ